MAYLISRIKDTVTDRDLRLNAKIATVFGFVLCRVLRGHKRGYRATKMSLRSGHWDIVSCWKLVK